jgi:hypothetical protein
MKKTRVLLVANGGGDFGALMFQQEFGGTPVQEVMNNLDKYVSEDETWYLEVFEYEGEIDLNFAKMIRSRVLDYDDSKNTTFYLETETIE